MQRGFVSFPSRESHLPSQPLEMSNGTHPWAFRLAVSPVLSTTLFRT